MSSRRLVAVAASVSVVVTFNVVGGIGEGPCLPEVDPSARSSHAPRELRRRGDVRHRVTLGEVLVTPGKDLALLHF